MPHPVLEMSEADYRAYIDQRSVGGSQVGAIMGISDYDDALSIYNSVLGLSRRGADNNHTRRGRIVEPHVADWYTTTTGRQLSQVPTRQSERYKFVRASPDRMIDAAAANRAGGEGVLEIKVLAIPNYRKTRNDGIAPSYYAQLQHYLDVCDKNWGAFAVFNADEWNGIHYDVERDDEYIGRIREAVSSFWNNHVLTRTPPAPQRDDDYIDPALMATIGAEAVRRDDDEWAEAIIALRMLTENKGVAEHAHKLAQARVKELMGDNGLIIGGGARVSYKPSTRRSLDTDALIAAHPEISLEEYYRVTATRVFRPTFDF